VIVLVLALAGALAFANGANDNCKGVATLVAFGAATERRALLWAALSTGAGSLVAIALAGGLVKAFRAGFVAGGERLAPAFFAAVLVGAVAWVLFATRTGLPVSTTHAIMGGLIGAGLPAVGAAAIGWAEVARRFALPLLLGPLLSLAVVYLLARPLRALAARTAARCVCVEAPVVLAPAGAGGVGAVGGLAIVTGASADCAAAGAAPIVEADRAMRLTHWGTAGLVGFARGWNDAPKIAALALVALPAAQGWVAFGLVAAAMAAGGLLAGRRVLDTLARKITALPLGESLAASGAAAVLVGLASWQGLPLSTTHVTTGGIVGAGLSRDRRGVQWTTVREIASSWVVTLPAAALAAALAYWLLARLG
jgi:PiT family inorganic phosphate transporter